MTEKQPPLVFADESNFVRAAIDDQRPRWACDVLGKTYYGLATTEHAFRMAVSEATCAAVVRISKDALWAMVRKELATEKSDA